MSPHWASDRECFPGHCGQVAHLTHSWSPVNVESSGVMRNTGRVTGLASVQSSVTDPNIRDVDMAHYITVRRYVLTLHESLNMKRAQLMQDQQKRFTDVTAHS